MPDTPRQFQFYAEHTLSHAFAGTVCAVHRWRTTATGYREALVAVTHHPRGGLTWSAVSDDYLAARCHEVSRAHASRLHPALVHRLLHDLHTT